MAIGDLAGGGAPGVDRHDLQPGIIPLRLRQTLVQHRVRPGGVRADQHHQIAVFHILIATGHHVGAKGPLVAGHRRRHAQPRIGVDVRRADKSLHQLVGGIVILRQQLAGGVEGHRLRTVLVDNLLQAGSGLRQRLRPGHRLAVHLRRQQPPRQTHGLP